MGCCGIFGKILCCGMCDEIECTCDRRRICMSIALFVLDAVVIIAGFARSGSDISKTAKRIYICIEVSGFIVINILCLVNLYRKKKHKPDDEESQLESARARPDVSATTNIHSSGCDEGSIHGSDGTNSDGQVQLQIGGISECDSLLPGKTRSDGPSGNTPTPRLVRKSLQRIFTHRSLPLLSASRPDIAEVPSPRSLDMEMCQLETVEERLEDFGL